MLPARFWGDKHFTAFEHIVTRCKRSGMHVVSLVWFCIFYVLATLLLVPVLGTMCSRFPLVLLLALVLTTGSQMAVSCMMRY